MPCRQPPKAYNIRRRGVCPPLFRISPVNISDFYIGLGLEKLRKDLHS
jgi:hypothetical protein